LIRHGLLALLLCAPLEAQTLRIYASRDQPIPSGESTPVHFDSELPQLPGQRGPSHFDASALQISSSMIQIQAPGVYLVGARAAFQANPAGRRQIYVKVYRTRDPQGDNPDFYFQFNSAPALPDAPTVVETHDLVALQAGDILVVNVSQNTGHPLNLEAYPRGRLPPGNPLYSEGYWAPVFWLARLDQ